MRVFLAGATGVIGRRLAVLLRQDLHEVTGTTRTAAMADGLRAIGVTPVVVDMLDAGAVMRAVAAARPEVVIHQLTDLAASAPGTPGYPAAQEANRCLRIRGHRESRSCMRRGGHPPGRRSARSCRRRHASTDDARHCRHVLETPGIDGVVLRYGYLYGPGTWYDAPPRPPSVYVDAAAKAALLAVGKGSGIYNITDDGAVSIAKAVRDLGFDPAFRVA